MGEDKVDCLTDGEDLGGLLIGHFGAVRIFKLLHQRVEIERVGLKIFLETGLLVDRRPVNVKLVGEVPTDQIKDVLVSHQAES